MNKVAAMTAIGRMTSKKRGNASSVKIQNVEPDNPVFKTKSKRRKDWVKKIIIVRTNAIKSVAIIKFLNI